MKRLTFIYFIIAASMMTMESKAGNSPETEIDKQVEQLLTQLTLDEKIALIHGSSKFTNGSVARLGIPELHMSDGPVGVRMEINRDNWNSPKLSNDNGAYFPAGTALAATWNPQLAYEMGKALGEESVARGKNIQLAPGINIIRTPLCGRNWEYMSEDPYLVASMVVPEIKGIQSNNVAACVKHFALNNQELDRGSIDVVVDDRALREIYLPGFEAAVKDGNSLAIMGAYNRYNGQFASQNKVLLVDILKNEWNFKGIVISDWQAAHSTVEAALFGLDIEMGSDACGSYDNYFLAHPLLEMVKSGKIDVAHIDDKVRRILRLAITLQLINKQPFDSTGMYAKLATPERAQTARNIAEESIVLLKNENALLPLHLNNITSIAVIGDNAKRKHATGGGSTVVYARYEISPFEALTKMAGSKIKINYAQGYAAPELSWTVDATVDKYDRALMREAVEAAKKSDIVLYFGGLNHNQGNDAEGADRSSMQLPYGQDNLLNEILKVNPKCVVVMLCGTPVELGDWYAKAPALIQHSYLGMEAGTALVNVITGKVNPSGKLAVSYPAKLSQSPAHLLGEYPGKDGKVHYTESIFVGYRYFDSKQVEPMFPFGFGLSYTTFEYSNIAVPPSVTTDQNEIKVSVVVKNTGNTDGSEVAQLYIHDVASTLTRPFKELKAFQKLALKAGESKTVNFIIAKKDLQYYNDFLRRWVLEPGVFEVLVGSSSKDIKQKGEFTLELD